MTHQLLDAVHTRACTGIKNAHNSLTVQNRTHVYMNFFDHKDLGNHLLQLYPKVVKHPVYIYRTNIPPTMIMNRIYENQNILYIIPLNSVSVSVKCLVLVNMYGNIIGSCSLGLQ